MNYIKPIIEQFADGFLMDERRRKNAEVICDYLTNSGQAQSIQDKYYEAVTSLLRDPDSMRVLLYLPFSELTGAPAGFREAYLDAWYRLLCVRDARENFHEGDTFELSARPNGELERVVKCAHLTPWLISAGYICCNDLLDILGSNRDNTILLQSFHETWRFIRDHKLLPVGEIDRLEAATSDLPPRKRLLPLYVSQKRIEWLQSRNTCSGQLLTPHAHLEGPFSPNLASMHDTLAEIESHLNPNDVVLVGGSQIKGYGTVDSDLDVWHLNDLEKHPRYYPGSPDAVHIYFDTVWIGGRSVVNLKKIAQEIVAEYRGTPYRRMALERLESDLLQYRLLHKGFSRMSGKKSFVTSAYTEMDGDCPFYDDAYRRIATMLFAKYVYVP